MSDREKPFTVSDRRHFTPDGQPRNEPAQPSEAPAEKQGMDAPRPDPPKPTVEGRAAVAGGKADFSAFVMSLAGQAEALLAGEERPEGASPKAALEGARSLIAILEMLKDKTEARRTPGEDELLEGVLFELRMEYVAKARVSGA